MKSKQKVRAMAYTTNKTILDGQVSLSVKGRTANVTAKVSAFEAAVPDLEKLPRRVLNLFYDCAYAFSATEAVEFNLTSESPPALHAWREFWVTFKDSRDYAAIWEAFAELIPYSIGDLWFEEADSANQVEFLAPIQLQHTEDELEPKNA